MSEQEQNKKINELNRRVARLEAFVKTFDLETSFRSQVVGSR